MANAFQYLAQQRMNGGAEPVETPNHFCGCTLWLTGLSGAGKTTIATFVRDFLKANRIPAYLLDGDVIRQGLSVDLGFSDIDRTENVRRISEVTRLLADSGVICIAAFISPFQKDRAFARELHEIADLKFYEIHVDTPIEECKKRDTKGLYARFERGEITGLTGVDAPYQTPESPEIRLETVEPTVEETGLEVIRYLVEQGVLNQSVFEEKKEEHSEEEEVEDLEEKLAEVDLGENSEKSPQKRKFKKKTGKKKKDRR